MSKVSRADSSQFETDPYRKLDDRMTRAEAGYHEAIDGIATSAERAEVTTYFATKYQHKSPSIVGVSCYLTSRYRGFNHQTSLLLASDEVAALVDEAVERGRRHE